MEDNIYSGLSGNGLLKLLKDFTKGCISENIEAKAEIKPHLFHSCVRDEKIQYFSDIIIQISIFKPQGKCFTFYLFISKQLINQF